MRVWSYGGGTQTIAIALLIEDGRLPLPDRIVMADTGYEFKKTWQYTEEYIQPRLQKLGRNIEIIPHSEAKVDLFSSTNEVLIPAFSTSGSGKLRNFCSGKWKTDVVRRYIRKTGVTTCDMWLGMSLDEIQRLKHSGLKWCNNYYPLCYDVKFTRGDCRAYILSHGMPEPPKSRCLMCPNQSDTLWLEVQQEPEEWQKAVALDEKIYQTHGVRLHKSRLPLPMVQLQPTQEQDGGLFDICDGGTCWT